MTEADEMLTEYQHALIDWFERMADAAAALTSQQRHDLETWERTRAVDGHPPTTSDWPGWEPLIGPRPRPSGESCPRWASVIEDEG